MMSAEIIAAIEQARRDLDTAVAAMGEPTICNVHAVLSTDATTLLFVVWFAEAVELFGSNMPMGFPCKLIVPLGNDDFNPSAFVREFLREPPSLTRHLR